MAIPKMSMRDAIDKVFDKIAWTVLIGTAITMFGLVAYALYTVWMTEPSLRGLLGIACAIVWSLVWVIARYAKKPLR